MTNDLRGTHTFISSDIMDQSPLIAAFGGLESFTYNHYKIEWVEEGKSEFGHNYSQVFVVGGYSRSQFDGAICEFTSIIERAFIAGRRIAADGVTTPNQAGGLLYFLTAEHGCHTTHGNGARLLPSDIEETMIEVPPNPELMLLCGEQAGAYLEEMKWAGAPYLSSPYLPETDVLLLRKGLIRIGHYTGQGRPHIQEILGVDAPPVLYADLSFIVCNVEKMGRLTGFKLQEEGERPL